jgi:small ligand-binding sensory domain FIST
VKLLSNAIIGNECALGLYIDCAGRASIMSGAEREEAEIVQQILSPSFPFMGFYSGVEIAPFSGNYSLPLDWTGVLTVLQYKK